MSRVDTVKTVFSCPMQQPLLAFGSWAPAIWRIGVDTSRVESIAPSAYRMFPATFKLQKARSQQTNSSSQLIMHLPSDHDTADKR